MAGTGYEIFALFMRYVFVALGGLILLRAFLWLRKDAGHYRKEIKNLPDAGLVGEVVDVDTGKCYPLPREGVLGAGRSCDIRIRGAGLHQKALRFLFVEGKGVQIVPAGRQTVYLDGEMMHGQGYALHGTQVETGSAVLRVRLFAGLKVPRRVLYDEDGVPLMPEDREVSPFEEVAGMFEPAADDAGMFDEGFGADVFADLMPPAAVQAEPYPTQGNVPQENRYMPQPMPGYAPQSTDVQCVPQQCPPDVYAPQPCPPQNPPYAPQNWQAPVSADSQTPIPQPVPQPERHRRSERYL